MINAPDGRPYLVLVRGGIAPADTPEDERGESEAGRAALDAAQVRLDAERLKLEGKPAEAAQEIIYAERSEAYLEAPLNFMAPTVTTAGEPPFGMTSAETFEDKELVTSIRNPSIVNATARIRTLRYAQEAGVLEDALALAGEIKAHGGIERMIAHQMAAAHRTVMVLSGQSAYHAYNASRHGKNPEYDTSGSDSQSRMDIRLQHNAAACRSALAAARMMDATASAALTLQELRKGKRAKMKYVVEKTVTIKGGAQGAGRAAGDEAGEARPTGNQKLRRTR